MGGKKIRELLAGKRFFQINSARERRHFHAKAQAAGFHTQTTKQYVVRKIKRCNSCGLISKSYRTVDKPQRRAPEINMGKTKYYENLEYATVEASRDPLPGCRCAKCLRHTLRILPDPIAKQIINALKN